MTLPTFIKGPGELLDYEVDWSQWLDGDTIATSTWTVPSGLTAGTATFTSTTATQFVSGGSLGQNYTLVNTITTADGRTAVRSLVIQVRTH